MDNGIKIKEIAGTLLNNPFLLNLILYQSFHLGPGCWGSMTNYAGKKMLMKHFCFMQNAVEENGAPKFTDKIENVINEECEKFQLKIEPDEH